MSVAQIHGHLAMYLNRSVVAGMCGKGRSPTRGEQEAREQKGGTHRPDITFNGMNLVTYFLHLEPNSNFLPFPQTLLPAWNQEFNKQACGE